ncbi:hypothetical protein ABL78_2123 [Leptomonas seymouri]|uniref:Transmembrane protein n=1 Tax=Leptomonas seymouri TaxID=5684 RepID=A0A0N1I7X6_LEPSE|nr:hypothetical protein ABL78_2123 [Leptomonas seymouri]|eukprot:KPI88744.1 hypothetical protein ABL78_2123 [Leptomonas seymouri]
MPAKRNASAPRSRSRKARSTSRSRTPTRPRSRRATAVTPDPASAASTVATLPETVSSTPRKPKETTPASMWEADAKLMSAMSSGRSHIRSTGVRSLFQGKRGRVWGYWIAIIVFQVLAIVWAKWAIDMYKQYRARGH